MDTPLAGEKLDQERAFIKRYTEGLAEHKVEYQADYSTPLEERPRKVPVVNVAVAEPPELMDVDAAPTQDASVTLTVKSLKPSLTLSVTAQLTDTVLDLKHLVAKSAPSAPPADQQRLLIKGKALTDTKLLKEYDVESGATIHLIVKPASASPAPAPAASSSSSVSGVPAGSPPALTITTSVDEDSKAGTSMPLEVTDAPPLGPQPTVGSAAFHESISDPSFWQKIHALCVGEFANESDADACWETFLLSMKTKLSAGEIAKIRDVVGVTAMGSGV